MTTITRTITVHITIEEHPTNPSLFIVDAVQANGIDLRPDYNSSDDLIWYLRDNPPGLPILQLRYRPGLEDDDTQSNIAAIHADLTPNNELLRPTWRWVDVNDLLPSDHVRDRSPGSGYDGTVHEVRSSHGSTCAIIHWNKWENEPLIDYKYSCQRVEVERSTPIPQLTSTQMVEVANQIGIDFLNPDPNEAFLHCRITSGSELEVVTKTLAKHNLAIIDQRVDNGHLFIKVVNSIDA